MTSAGTPDRIRLSVLGIRVNFARAATSSPSGCAAVRSDGVINSIKAVVSGKDMDHRFFYALFPLVDSSRVLGLRLGCVLVLQSG